MPSEKNSLYNFIFNIIEQQISIREEELVSSALELGRDTNGLRLVKALSDLAYSRNQLSVGGILHSAHWEAEKRLSAGLEYYRLVSPQKASLPPSLGVEDWRADSPVWANTVDKESLLTGTKLQDTDIDKILASELYTTLYRGFWSYLFSSEENIKQISENKKYGWELRRNCINLTTAAIYGAGVVEGQNLNIGAYLFYDKYILQIESLNKGLESILVKTKFQFSSGSKIIDVQPNERMIVLPNFKN